MNKVVFASVATVLLSQPFAVKAQVPASVDPANIMNSVNKTLPVPASPPVQKDLGDTNSSPAPDLSAQAAVQVLLTKVELSGAIHPVPATVTAVYRPLIGQRVTFGAIQKTVADMQDAYRNAGYFLVQVVLPPQEIDQDNGIVQIRIVEGQIEKVVFQQELPRAVAAQMQRYVEPVEKEDPITYPSVDRFLLLANDLPGIQVAATLMPDPNATGGSDLLMTTTHTRGSGFINFNNYGTKYIGPNQVSVGGSLYDLLGADALSAAVATNPNHVGELAYGNIDYGVVMGAYGTRVDASATVTHTEPGSNLSAFDMKGKSTEYMLRVQQPLILSTSHRLTLLASLSRLDSHNDISGDRQLYKDVLAPLMIGLGYQGVIAQAYNDIQFTVTKGLPLFGASRDLDNPSVVGATPDFLRFNLESTTIRYVAPKTSIAFGTQFQLSEDRMVASERISYGGAQFGQAYHFNVLSGDSGAMGSLALRYDLPTQSWMNLLQPEIFYDIGTVHLNHTTAGESANATATAAGLGLNLQLLDRVKTRFTLAKPLSIKRSPDVDTGWQSFFNVTCVF